MTKRRDLLNPQVSTQRLAPADRETLETVRELLDKCATLVAAQGATMEQTAAGQQAMLQACTDTLKHLAERSDARDRDDAARHAELMAAAGAIPAAIADLAERVDRARLDDTAGMRNALAGLGATLDRVAVTCMSHDRRHRETAEALRVMAHTMASLRDPTQGARAGEARASQARTPGDPARQTASPGARFGRVAQAWSWRGNDWRAILTIPLLLGFVYGAGLMTDVMVRFIDGSAGQSAPVVTVVTDLPPWPLPDALPEITTPE